MAILRLIDRATRIVGMAAMMGPKFGIKTRVPAIKASDNHKGMPTIARAMAVKTKTKLMEMNLPKSHLVRLEDNLISNSSAFHALWAE